MYIFFSFILRIGFYSGFMSDLVAQVKWKWEHMNYLLRFQENKILKRSADVHMFMWFMYRPVLFLQKIYLSHGNWNFLFFTFCRKYAPGALAHYVVDNSWPLSLSFLWIKYKFRPKLVQLLELRKNMLLEKNFNQVGSLRLPCLLTFKKLSSRYLILVVAFVNLTSIFLVSLTLSFRWLHMVKDSANMWLEIRLKLLAVKGKGKKYLEDGLSTWFGSRI